MTKESEYDEISRWYDKKITERGVNSWRPEHCYWYFLKKMLGGIKGVNDSAGKRHLDIGCGVGYLLDLSYHLGLITYGVDISPKTIEIARKVTPDSELSVGNMENLKYQDEYFDCISCIGSLEHAIDLKMSLSEIERVGRKGCRYLIVVPNKDFILWKFRKEKGTDQSEISETLKTIKEWKELFEDSGFYVVSISKDLSVSEKYNPLKSFFVALLIKLIPIKYTYQGVYLLK